MAQSLGSRPPFSYAMQFALLLGIMGMSLIAGAFIMAQVTAWILHISMDEVVFALKDPKNIGLSRAMNTFTAAFVFLLPAWGVSRLVSPDAWGLMGMRTPVKRLQWVVVLFIAAGALFLGGALATLNDWIPVSAAFRTQALAWEKNYRDAMLSMATMRNGWDYVFTLLTIALAPAIFEEALFRGTLQRILTGWSGNAFLGILVTSVLFSAIHGSYFGFLPRIGLGVILGLVYYYSTSLKLAMWLHFLNNAFVVTVLYWYQQTGRNMEKAMDENMPVWVGLLSLLVLVPALLILKRKTPRHQRSAHWGETTETA